MAEQDRLYNSRLTRVYLDYLQATYPETDVEGLLKHAGMAKWEVDDPAHWFTQQQVDRFQDKLIEITGDRAIAREAGRYNGSSESFGPIRSYLMGFLNPANIYTLIGKFIPLLTRGAAITSRRLGNAKVEITATPYPGVKEKPYQCENRIGNLESIGLHFSNRYSRVEHPECYHRGGACCRYVISWKTSPSMRWRRIRRYSLVFDILAAVLAGLLLTPWMACAAILALALKTAGITIYGLHIENRDLSRIVVAQGDAAQEHINEANSRYSNALLVQEVGRATATILNKQELLTAVLGIMAKRLEFDRGSILLADRKRRYLVYRGGYGFGQTYDARLRQVRFNLNNPHSQGIFVRSFWDQKPLIIDDLDAIKQNLSARSQSLVKEIRARALICVPIIYEKVPLGIVAVDNHKSKRKLTQSDLNLMMGLASQLALGISNSESFQKLQKSEERYRDIFENVSDFLYFHDLEGRFIETNRSFQRVSGYSPDQLAGMTIRDMVPERFREAFDTYLNQIKRDGHFEGTTRLLRNDGREFIIEYKNSLVYDQDRAIGVRGSARDVTERLLALKEKKSLEKQLEQAEKMKAIGTLAGGVAHDLNNILSGIVSYPDLLLMDLPAGSHLREPIRTIRDSGQKAAAIVQDLLTMARRGVSVGDVADLNTIVADYLASPEHAKIMSYHPDVRLECQLVDAALNIMGSPMHLAKTVMNLVSNAAEAMPDGGCITIRTAYRYVGVPVKGYDIIVEGDYAVLEIADTGVGISESDRKRIFEPFYTKKIMGRSGTGLGMSVVWATVKDHKGYIDVVSDIGAGTTFTLYFPVSRKALAEKALAPSIASYQGQGERILVVDDVADQREIASVMLKRLGYRVQTAPSGEAALTAVQDRMPDLVVLDMIMDPGMDGLETYQRMLAINPGQRAVIASGYSESEKVRAAMRIGAGAYIKKPYLLGKIARAVREVLDRPAVASEASRITTDGNDPHLGLDVGKETLL
jgi:PAS domain S-box-containing protein